MVPIGWTIPIGAAVTTPGKQGYAITSQYLSGEPSRADIEIYYFCHIPALAYVSLTTCLAGCGPVNA